VRAGLYDYGGNSADAFLGQSYRLDNDDNPFPAGSGLDNQSSDIVGSFSTYISNHYNINYRFQLASDNFSSQRHEVDASAQWNRLNLATRYLYAAGLEDTTIDENREQIDNAVGYYLTKEWQVRAGATHDLGEDPGLRRAFAGIDYFGQCWSWALVGQRNFTDDSSGESDTTVLFTIGLKNLGGFIEPNYAGTQFAKEQEEEKHRP
jgi:LPS-assembly protein